MVTAACWEIFMQNLGLFCIFETLLIAKCCMHFRLLEGLAERGSMCKCKHEAVCWALFAQRAGRQQMHVFLMAEKQGACFQSASVSWILYV